jgi:hypothetical protein
MSPPTVTPRACTVVLPDFKYAMMESTTASLS